MTKIELQLAMKRLIDVLFSSLFIFITALPLALISIALKLDSRGPVIFKQNRAGRNGKVFPVYKLRSMKALDENENLNYTKHSVTRVGRVIRKWRLDEMPQFINVLKGDMSIVGPRPTLPYQVKRYDAEQAKRLAVKPGITGWSQIHGDTAINWPERIELDVWYAGNWSIWLDIRIMLQTPLAILRIRNVNTAESPSEDPISIMKNNDQLF